MHRIVEKMKEKPKLNKMDRDYLRNLLKTNNGTEKAELIQNVLQLEESENGRYKSKSQNYKTEINIENEIYDDLDELFDEVSQNDIKFIDRDKGVER